MREIGPHPTVAAIALLGVMVCGLISTVKIWDMVAELNAKLPDKETFSYLGWHGPKYKRFTREYKRCFPDSHNLSYIRAVFISMIGLFIVAAWAMGFFVGR
jgi:hypothetical protein